MGSYYITEESSAMRDPEKNMKRTDYRLEAIRILSAYLNSTHNLDEFFERQFEEYTVVLFLIAIGEMLKYSISLYDNNKSKCYFEKILDGNHSIDKDTGKLNVLKCQKDKHAIIRPFSRMVDGVIKALDGKTSAAESNDHEARCRKLNILRGALKSIDKSFQDWLSAKVKVYVDSQNIAR